MKQKSIIFIIMLTLFICMFTGCKKEEPVVCSSCSEEKECKTYEINGTAYLVCDDCSKDFIAGMTTGEEEKNPVCSECKQEKDCKTYVINNVDYLVCDNCYESFAAAKGLTDPDVVECSLCELVKDCTVYTIDGEDYVVCDSCYDEFAYAFGLEDAPEDIPFEYSQPTPVCSLCEMEKDCDTYTVDGMEYVVCPDCYNEFATAFGLLDSPEEAEVPEAIPEAAPEDTQEETDPEIIPTQVCGGCEKEKSCKTYTIDEIDYIVCDDCYEEFAHGMGLIE